MFTVTRPTYCVGKPDPAARALAVVLTLLAVMTALVLAAPAATADPSPPPDPALRAQADSIMNMHYLDFIHFKQEQHPAPFNWSDDGCSGPPGVKIVYRELFKRPCQLHDFGYRNYGRHAGGLALHPTEGTRAWIDKRLLTEMSRLCDRNFGALWQGVNNNLCKSEANTMYRAVRDAMGRHAFYS